LKHSKSIFFLSLVAVAVASVSLTLFFTNFSSQETGSVNTEPKRSDGFLTNEKFIDSLYMEMDLNDADEVFRYVFSNLDDEIFIYPTENYYYFTFPANGKTIWGSFHLPAYSLDEGFLSFGYVDKGNDVNEPPIYGGSVDFYSGDNMEIKKIDDFAYSITIEEQTKIFRLNQQDLNPPVNALLTDDEIFIEPTFDESGLRFFLIFNNSTKQIYWVLNEDGYVPETFTSYDEIEFGDRTGFAFYPDYANNRKILVGIYGPNVMANNWYDGPFDQLLDNYVYLGQVEIKKYMEESYPSAVGRLDDYGNYLDNETRLAIGTYSIYFYKDELVDVIYSCEDSETDSEFYDCITAENHLILLDPPFP